MPSYAVLVHPSHNRVYAGASASLTAGELQVICPDVSGVTTDRISGVDYVTFTAEAVPERIGWLSGLLALFEMQDGLLRPVEVRSRLRHPEDLLTIQRYPGKTNESFTRLLLNVTMAAAARPVRTLLDPLCGRGTTLNAGLLHGLDVSGIEADQRDVDHYAAFLLQWLRERRYKHTSKRSSISRTGKPKAVRIDVELAPDKKAPKQAVSVVADVTRFALDHFGRASFDLVVADLPYGVQHGAHTDTLARTPDDLLTEALPVWTALLRRGGALGLAYNTRVLSPDRLSELLAQNGLQRPDIPSFEHRVDASITRDLVVAIKA